MVGLIANPSVKENVATRSISLDVLRILAALWVVSYHWTNHGGFYPKLDLGVFPALPSELNALTSVGWLGVDVFFILSGAVIARTALNRNWVQFSQSRFLRLFPVFVVSSLLTLALVPLVLPSEPRSEYLVSLTGLHFWTGDPGLLGTAWTLPIEVHFYALVALLIWRSGPLAPEKIRLAVFGFLLLTLVANLSGWDVAKHLVLASWAPYFALGALVSVTHNLQELRRNALGLFVAITLSASKLNDRLNVISPDLKSWVQSLLLAIVLLVVLVFLFTSSFGSGTSPKTAWVAKSVATLSLMTYPIYLLHEQVGLSLLQLLYRDLHLTLVQGLLAVGCFVVVCSFALVKFVEPMMRKALKRAFGWS